MDLYAITLTLICAVIIGNTMYDLRVKLTPAKQVAIVGIKTIVLSDKMAYHAACNVCQLCGWRLERRGMQLILWQGYSCQHSAVMA